MREPLSLHTPADNPYGVLLALATASSGVRKVSTESTGPKISSWAMRLLWPTPVKTVGANQYPLAGSSHGACQMTAPSSSPAATSSVMPASCAAEVTRRRGGVGGAVVGVFVGRSPGAGGPAPPLQLGDPGVVHALLPRQPRAGAAPVALVEEEAVHDPFDRLVDRRVVEDDVGR